MFVEASVMRGKGELVLTGQAGDVMKESARAALTYANRTQTSRYPEVRSWIPTFTFTCRPGHSKEVHRWSDDGETALVSRCHGGRRGHDIADGRSHPAGQVLPIGGVKEKSSSRARGTLIGDFAERERADLEDLPDEVRKTLEVHLVEDLGEVLSLALRGARFESGHLIFEHRSPSGGSGGVGER